LYDLLMNLLALFKCHHTSTCIHQPMSVTTSSYTHSRSNLLK
jgi:hypothetical protein